ncbi:MAG: hypothetical protein ACRDOU_28605 [Streptosporangiaceae bacterium]
MAVVASDLVARGLLAHLATWPATRSSSLAPPATVPMLAEPTHAQREAFRLLAVPIPLTLTLT